MLNKALAVATMLALFLIIFPDAKTAYDSFITTMLEITGITGGLAYLMLTTLPYWVIGAVIFRVVMTLIKRDSPGGM